MTEPVAEPVAGPVTEPVAEPVTEPVNSQAAGHVACPACGTPTTAGERFCENCGAELPGAAAPAAPASDPDAAPVELTERRAPAGPPLAAGVLVDSRDLGAPPAACADCGGAIAADGYCEQCGTPARRPRDHFTEHPVPWVGAVCDRGVRHARNEDAVALAARPEPASFAVLVVCDGVSSAPDSDVASLAAARAARDVLAAPPTSPPATAEELLVRSASAANDAAAAVAQQVAGPNPPSCTFVAAVLGSAHDADGPPDTPSTSAVVAWIGDSRAYWFPDAGTPLQVSTDDSWAAEAMRLHGLSREEAERLPQAHAITRWLGADSPEGPPRTAVVDVTAPGWLMLCSDGLWNYCSAPEDLAALLAATAGRVGTEPVALCEALTAWANEQGGHDNITVALARCGTS